MEDNPIAYANAGFCALCGYPESEVVGRNCRFLQGQDTDRFIVAEIAAAVASGLSIRREILNYRKDGTSFWNDLTIDPIRDASGRLTGFVSIQSESQRDRITNELKAESELRLNNMTSHIPGYVYQRVMRNDGTIDIVYCSPSLGRILGIPDADMLRVFYDRIHPDDLQHVLASVRKSAADMSVFREEFRLLSADGTAHWLRSDAPPRRTANNEIVWDGIALEITAEKRWQNEIAALATHDPLTGLLNREAWRQTLELGLGAEGSEGHRCGVLYVDIEAFRDLNDKLGQRLCDDLLREVARRLTAATVSVGGVAARMGGDEFAVLLPACSSDDALSRLASECGEALAHPIDVGGQDVSIRTCIGAALYAGMGVQKPANNDAAIELMTQAELALRWAKQSGRGAHVVYSAEEDDRLRNQAVLARSLERAIAEDELELHYQPLVDLASGRILSAEALVRWNHPTLGMQRPDLFIPLAERSGLIVPLGRWVLKQAVRQRTAWQNAGLAPPPIAVNVAGAELTEPGFVAFIEDSLLELGGSACDFEIELTEGQLIEASPQIMAVLKALRSLGLTIAIDDFGSGHASFRYLRDFPVNKLKIDQIFVRHLVLGSSDALIIRALISLARGMGIALVAEGIENEMQRDFLQREGCRIGQGYLFSMPLVAEDFAWLLANDVRLPLRPDVEQAPEGQMFGPRSSMGSQ